MDEAFCARMRAAIGAGQESAPVGVTTTPGTRNPKFVPTKQVVRFSQSGVAFVVGQPTSVTAEQSYPWCAQGDNILHCYYMTREQCEAAVNDQGFCVANSNVPILNNEAPQPRLRNMISEGIRIIAMVF